ncbi:MAG: phytanoyl-CoA dioxygenase family protein [Phycisphaeraceae bacterium]
MTTDTQSIPLCTTHAPITDLFTAAADTRHAPDLPAEQVTTYRERGFLHPVDLLTPDQIQALRDALDRMTDPAYPHAEHLAGPRGGDTPVVHFLGAWLVEPAYHDLVFNPRVTTACAQLLGTNQVRFLHDQLFYKPPRHGGVVAWHQDYSYWKRTTPPGHLTCYIALDDTTLDNGCMQTIPGSHRWPLLEQATLIGDESDMDAIKAQLTPDQLAAFEPAPIELKAGQCSFHDCMTVHGSYPNRSDRPRRGVVLNYMKPDTRSATDRPIMGGAEPVPPGEIITGDYFPIVIDRQT